MDRQAAQRLTADGGPAGPPQRQPSDDLPRVDVLGVGVNVVDPSQALARVTRWIEQRRQRYVCVTGVHGVMESQRDPALRDIHNASGLTVPDGVPMVWAGRWAGAEHMERVYGPEFMLAVLARAAERGWRSYLYGGRPGVAELLAQRLTARLPGVQFVGMESPPFRPLTPAEEEATVARINAAAPDIIWVGLGTPKQERWMAAHVGRLQAPALVGVGAAFDFHAGLLPQAPAWMQRRGLEWLYRLMREPRRLWRRYLVNNPLFVAAILRRPPRLLPD